MNPLLQQFLTEGRDFIEQIGRKLLILEETPDDDAVIGELFRFVHTLKGNSGLFDLPILTKVVHAAEDLLDRVRDHELPVTPDLTDELLEAMDFVVRLLDEVEDSGSIPDSYLAPAADLTERLRDLLPDRFADDEPQDSVEALPPPSDWSWLKRLNETQRISAFDQAGTDRKLTGLHYVPEPQCFFKGEDPVLFLRQIPGLAGFAIRTAQAWPPLSDLDIYAANLMIDALSVAARAELDDHVRYVPEQVALYVLPAYALALPEGETSEVPGVYADFLETARACLARNDLAGLDSAIDAILDMLNPDLFMASALRWCRRLRKQGFAAPVLTFHIEATALHRTPDWYAFHQTEAALQPAPAVAPPQTVVPASAAVPAMNDLPDPAIWDDIFIAQREIVSLPVADAEWGGRFASVYNALVSLFRIKGDRKALSALGDAAELSEQDRSFAPLVAFLDSVHPTNAVTAAVEPVVVDEIPLATPVAAVVELAAERQIRLDRRAVEGAMEGGRRAADGGSDKGVRVLKVTQEKVDRLMDLIGEMVVAKNALPYLATRAEDVFGSRELAREIKSQYSIINRIAEEMQDGIMQVRMLPVDAIFQRFPRLVRDVAKQLGKKVRIVVEGEDTEADKNIIESLGDPMIHILRNSLDHGIEMPDVRLAAGKPEEGRLSVRASQEGDRVLIEIEDDGKGIDPAVIKRKAFEKGLIDEQRLETISDQDAVQLVFAAGFSTAETVSNLSGRGVGMDVVRSSLEKVGGQVRLTSEKGKGTRIILSLPLSMSVSNVMMVDIGGQHFGVPMDVVVETVRIKESDIHVFKQRRTAVLRGRIVPLYSTDEMLASHEKPKPNADGEFAVLLARVHGETVGIVVDGFAQTIDVILKPLEGPLTGLAGFAGSALLGNGSVLLVLNIKELI